MAVRKQLGGVGFPFSPLCVIQRSNWGHQAYTASAFLPSHVTSPGCPTMTGHSAVIYSQHVDPLRAWAALWLCKKKLLRPKLTPALMWVQTIEVSFKKQYKWGMEGEWHHSKGTHLTASAGNHGYQLWQPYWQQCLRWDVSLHLVCVKAWVHSPAPNSPQQTSYPYCSPKKKW